MYSANIKQSLNSRKKEAIAIPPKAEEGGLSFRYFSLATQRKVTRLSVRSIGLEPIDIYPQGETHGCVS
jgi:hypothetical protein